MPYDGFGAWFDDEEEDDMPRVFDNDGAPIDYQRLGTLAPEPPREWEFNGTLRAEWEVRDFPTTATNDDELLAELRAFFAQDADVLDFDTED